MSNTYKAEAGIAPKCSFLMRMCIGVSKGIDGLSGLSAGLAAIAVLFMALSIGAEVFMRTFFDKPSSWTLEISIYVTIAMAFLGAAYGTQTERHVCVDIFTSRLSPRMRSILEVVTNVVGILAVVFFSYSAMKLISVSRMTHATSQAVHIPLSWPQGIMFFGSILLLLQLFKITIKKISALRRTDEHEAKGDESEAGLPRSRTFFDKPIALFSIFVVAAVIGSFLLTLGGTLSVFGIVILVFTFLLSGMPIYLGLIVMASLGLYLLMPGGFLMTQLGLAQAGYQALDKFELAAIPLFLLGGSMLGTGNLSDRLFDFFQVFTYRVPGGLAIASVLTCAAFGAMCGSGLSGALTIGVVAIPAMIARGYEPKFSIGCLACAGTLAILIPPSIPMIVYSSQTGASVSSLFAAGIIPGLLLTVMLCGFIFFRVWKKPLYRNTQDLTRSQKARMLKAGVPLLVIPVGLLTAIYSGAATPTEAAAVFSIYTLIIGFALGNIKMSNIWDTLRTTAVVASLLLMILVGAMVFNLVVARIQAIETLTSWAMHPMLPPWLVIVASMALLIVGGMIFESGAMITIVTPIVVPIVVALGFNEVWMGILMTINCEIAQMSPPVGIVLYALYAALGGKMNLTMEDVMKGALPFMIPLMIVLILVGLFPMLSLWLPSILMGR